MTPHPLSDEIIPLPKPPPAAPESRPAGRRRGRFWGLLTIVILTLAGGAVCLWWQLRPPAVAPVVPPPVPPNIQDAEIRELIETTRQDVLDHRQSADAWGRLGMVLLAQLFDIDADRCFAEAADLDPNDARWPYARGLLALKRHPDNALPFLRKAIANESRPEILSDYSMQLAEALVERRELDEAEGLFHQWYDSDPNNLRAAYGLGLIALARDKDQEAEKFLTAARASPFARKKATAELATLARARGDEAAAAVLEKETKTLPDDPPWPDPFLDLVYQLSVGQRGWERDVGQLERDHQYAEAAQKYLDHIKKAPTSASYVGAGVNLARLHEYDRALPLLREGVRLDPTSDQAQYTLALVLFSRAEREWQQTPGAADAKDWFREAIPHAKRAAELKPDHGRAYLFWGLSLKYLGDPAAALVPLRKGVEIRPEISDLQIALGETLLETGQDREAETYLENAQRLDPNDPRLVKDMERLHKKTK
jgi:tetratricopeptide (TPR) repeat protein